MLKEEACELFLAAVYQDALDIAEQIASQVSASGTQSTLIAEIGLQIFCGEWYLAKLAWLSQRAKELEDNELREYLSKLIENHVNDLYVLYEDDPMIYPNYCLLANSYDKGEKDHLGSVNGPGPFISSRYERNLKRLKPESSFKPTDNESMLIMAVGDGACWYLQKDINDGLKSIIYALDKDQNS